MKDWRKTVREAACQAVEKETACYAGITLHCRWERVRAVATTARRLAELTGADSDVVEAAAWLHDVDKNEKSQIGQDLHGQSGTRNCSPVSDSSPGRTV